MKTNENNQILGKLEIYSEPSGAYIFVESIMAPEKVSEFLSKK